MLSLKTAGTVQPDKGRDRHRAPACPAQTARSSSALGGGGPPAGPRAKPRGGGSANPRCRDVTLKRREDGHWSIGQESINGAARSGLDGLPRHRRQRITRTYLPDSPGLCWFSSDSGLSGACLSPARRPTSGDRIAGVGIVRGHLRALEELGRRSARRPARWRPGAASTWPRRWPRGALAGVPAETDANRGLRGAVTGWVGAGGAEIRRLPLILFIGFFYRRRPWSIEESISRSSPAGTGHGGRDRADHRMLRPGRPPEQILDQASLAVLERRAVPRAGATRAPPVATGRRLVGARGDAGLVEVGYTRTLAGGGDRAGACSSSNSRR